MSAPLSIAEQVQVLFSDKDAATFALQHLGLPGEWRDTNQAGNVERCQDAVNRVFTLSRGDVEGYLLSRGIQPEELPFVQTTLGSRDGWYLIHRAGDWEYSWQERGFPNFLWTFSDLAEARKVILNQFISVWLKHLHVPGQTKTGEMVTHP